MILFEITQHESHPAYVELEISNGERQSAFLRSIVQATISVQKAFLSHDVLKALNFHAISCLHTHAGEYRPCPVSVGDYRPPAAYQVQALMDDFINVTNRRWEALDGGVLASYVLWRLNHIHPFINGNGRTARAAAYFVLCLKLGGWLPGSPALPELLKKNRVRYVEALKVADLSWQQGALNLAPLHGLVNELLMEQLASAQRSDPHRGR